jgi:hypothetical protein
MVLCNREPIDMMCCQRPCCAVKNGIMQKEKITTFIFPYCIDRGMDVRVSATHGGSFKSFSRILALSFKNSALIHYSCPIIQSH